MVSDHANTLGGSDRAEVLAKFEACRTALGIVLVPVEPPREVAALADFAPLAMSGEDAASRP